MNSMASSCMATCINDIARVPVRATYVNLYKWPESDAEFVRSVSADGGGRAHANPRVIDSISCRQIYLRSYTFSRKEETFHEKITKKCFGGVKERVRKGITNHNNYYHYKFIVKEKCLVLRKAKQASCDALLFMFHRMLACSAKVDVADDDHNEQIY